MAHEIEVGHIPEGGGVNFTPDPAGINTRVTRKEYLTQSGYLTFDPSGLSTINWVPIGVSR